MSLNRGSFDIFKNLNESFEREVLKPINRRKMNESIDIEDLVNDIVYFSKEYDSFDFMDNYSDDEEAAEQFRKDLSSYSGRKSIVNFLDNVKEDNPDLDEGTIEAIDSIITRINMITEAAPNNVDKAPTPVTTDTTDSEKVDEVTPTEENEVDKVVNDAIEEMRESELVDQYNGYSLYKVGKTTTPGHSIYKMVNDKTKEEQSVGLEDETAVKFFREDTKHAWKSEKVEEAANIKISEVEPELDYIITDVTVLNPVGDGDVQAPDIDAMLTLVDEALKSEYTNEWGRIKTLSSRVNENDSFALVDISTPELLKEFEERGIKDAAIGTNLILERVGNLFEFKVNNLNGTTKYSKKTTDPQKAIYEWVESEFLQEAKEAKIKELEFMKAKNEKETVEDYIANRRDLKQEIENIKMFIELGKEVKASEEMKPSIQKRMYAFVAEMPHSIEVTNKDDKYELTFSNPDQIVEMIFGKEWVEEKEEVPEVVKINESYEQFNIGDIEVIFNPETYETLYSIPSADVKDKKINLTKVPTVETPYDTDTIIKSYIETRFGQIPSEEEKKMIDQGEVSAPETEEVPVEPESTENEVEVDVNIDNPDEEINEDELPEEPTEQELQADTSVDTEADTEEIQAETGNSIFMKIRPKQSLSIEDLRKRDLSGDIPSSTYIVVDNIDLSDEEWNDLTSRMNEERDWLSNIQDIDRKNYSFNVVKVSNSNANFDLLIDPLGYAYPRYVSIIDKTI